MEKIYRVQMNSKGMPNFATAIEIEDLPIYGNEHNCMMTIFGECSYAETGCGDCAVVEKVRRALSADRPQGEWIAVSAFDAFGGDEATWMVHGNPTAFHYCSECKEQTRIDEFGEEILSNYCPHCGARMKGALVEGAGHD